MVKVILIRYGELVLKGLNRGYFEDKLISNIKLAMQDTSEVKITKTRSRIYIEPYSNQYNFEDTVEKLSNVFGIASISIALKVDTDLELIQETAINLVTQLTQNNSFKTFKVETKRENKSFPMNSMQINATLGQQILNKIPGLSVNVIKPDFKIYVEIRDHAYIYSNIVPAFGGIPVGISGNGLLLLSGGIDSPVAGWMMAKRGVSIDAIHFYSYPYTSERAKDKVISLANILSRYCGTISLYMIPFTDIQLEINKKCPSSQSTIIMRRLMMMIAQKIANSSGSSALITGESMGQVASQTMEGLVVTDNAVSMPVFRPLIGWDKNEVIQTARQIGTFDTSILPYQDCCTVFVAKHPETKPRLDKILKSESNLDIDTLICLALDKVEKLSIG